MQGTRQLPAFNGRRLEVNGLRLNVVIEGEGPEVLLVHGFPDSHQVWRKQIPALVTAGYRVIAPDLRGFGASDAPPETSAYAIERFVIDLVGVLDALGVGKVRMVAHDWGAACGWALAIAHPERVDRYVAMSVGHPEAYPRGGLAQKLKGYYVLFMQLRGVAEFLMKLFDWRFFRLITGFHPEFAHWRAELERPGRLTSAISFYRANLNLIFPAKYPRVKVPVLGIWSSKDIALARRQMVLSGEYVDAPWRYEQIEGASHWLQLDAPEAVNALLLDYLR